jgi:hypothetical protein
VVASSASSAAPPAASAAPSAPAPAEMTLAERLTGPVAAWDGPVNAAGDAFEAGFGWAWLAALDSTP